MENTKKDGGRAARKHAVEMKKIGSGRSEAKTGSEGGGASKLDTIKLDSKIFQMHNLI